jgi:hypothetical protein
MMLTRTRLRTRLLADQAQAALADVTSAADQLIVTARAFPADDMSDALHAVQRAAGVHTLAADRIGKAADDISLTVACVGAALIVFFAVGVWRATRD